ncbi:MULTISPECIES: hypothetical protein [unclassified Leucobacter]|uniref:hypothetical protein n=1 Tax=unclassified Leucobacter TaxID=2621730 RepID=UPI000621DF5E|nr:hypothetical protein [Leucobacter sp. Ag1]KKI16394.1 hypothetical protein XM48_16515 [Leucobacter sp. Ag1]
MSATVTPDFDERVLEQLDFAPRCEVLIERSRCENSAAFILRCRTCGGGGGLICETCLAEARAGEAAGAARRLRCRACGASFIGLDEGIEVIPL